MMKWVIELSEYDIQYKPHLSLKFQVLVAFIIGIPQRWMQSNTDNRDQWWILHVDEASKASRAKLGLTL